MRPSTYATPGLGDKMNGKLESILGEWRQQQKATQKQKSTSLSANKRKKQFDKD